MLTSAAGREEPTPNEMTVAGRPARHTEAREARDGSRADPHTYTAAALTGPERSNTKCACQTATALQAVPNVYGAGELSPQERVMCSLRSKVAL